MSEFGVGQCVNVTAYQAVVIVGMLVNRLLECKWKIKNFNRI